ncbi:MAG: HNH endonuclease [Mesorhizobium sp.]|nr:MAG: HNH endonuclease [Mesorhizobium sp.]
MRSLVMRQHDYRLDGRCVYCRTDMSGYAADEVTDEHIIPRALNGTLVIRNGACAECARLSNKNYEAAALNSDLLVPRRLLELKASRRRGKNQSAPRPLPPVALGDCGVFDLDLAREDYPQFFSLVVFQPAGLLIGVDRGGDLQNPSFQSFNLGGKSRDSDVTTKHTMINGPFAMMLAKIAYCYATAKWGESFFDAKDIRDLLLGRRNDVYNFVGNTESPERLTTRILHGLYVRHRGEWLTVLVHLFASCHDTKDSSDCHPYEVVVGRAL